MCAARVLDREVNPAHYDRLRVLLVCQPEKMADTQAFYCDVLGFHLEFEQAGEDGARLVALRNDGSRVMLGEPGALGVVPSEVSSSVVITLEHPNATGFHGLLERRDGCPVFRFAPWAERPSSRSPIPQGIGCGSSRPTKRRRTDDAQPVLCDRLHLHEPKVSA